MGERGEGKTREERVGRRGRRLEGAVWGRRERNRYKKHSVTFTA